MGTAYGAPFPTARQAFPLPDFGVFGHSYRYECPGALPALDAWPVWASVVYEAPPLRTRRAKRVLHPSRPGQPRPVLPSFRF